MSSLSISQSKIRVAAVTLAAIVIAIPTAYLSLTAIIKEETPHVCTFKKYVAAYSTLRPKALTATASRDFTHAILPTSLQLPCRTLEPFKLHASMIFSLFTSFQMIPQSPGPIHFARETNTVIAHCRMGGTVNGNDKNGKILRECGIHEWWTECVLIVRMDDSGRKVVEVREFVDSAKAEELQKKLQNVLGA